jgi:hypothetical protein
MKTILFVGLLALLVDAAVLTLERTGAGIGSIPGYHLDMFDKETIMRSIDSSKFPAAKPYKLESIPPKLNPEAKRIRLIYGPYLVKGSEVCTLSLQ